MCVWVGGGPGGWWLGWGGGGKMEVDQRGSWILGCRGVGWGWGGWEGANTCFLAAGDVRKRVRVGDHSLLLLQKGLIAGAREGR